MPGISPVYPDDPPPSYVRHNPHQIRAKDKARKSRLSDGSVTVEIVKKKEKEKKERAKKEKEKKESEDEDDEGQPDPLELEEYDDFYKSTKSLLVLFQIMGIMPIERADLGRTTYRWFAPTTIYAYVLFICESIYVSFVFKERVLLMVQRGRRFDEYIYNFIFVSILVPHFLLPLASWRNGYEVAKFKNMWTQFQYKFFKSTGTAIHFPYLEFITWASCIASWVVSIAIMIAQYMLQPDLLLWHTGAYYHILAMLNCLCSLWYVNCTAMGIASKGLSINLNLALQSNNSASTLARYRDLWVDLSHIMQQLGKAYSGMYAMYCILILLTTIVATYGCLTEILDHGLSNKETGLVMIAVFCMSLLYIICNEAYHASKKMGPDFQEKLLNVNLAAVDHDTQKEVDMFLTAIAKNPPTMNLNGYADINRKLISTTVSAMVTYLVVLMQFKLSLMRSEKLRHRHQFRKFHHQAILAAADAARERALGVLSHN